MSEELNGLLRDARRLRPSRLNAPDVLEGRWDHQRAFIKSYHHCPALYRQTVGRLALTREWSALQKLSGLGRAPQPIARPLPWIVVMQWVEGYPLESLPAGQVSPRRLLEEAESLLSDLHGAGVVHGDLGHDFWSVCGRECNLVVTPEQRLVAIDFAGSWPLESLLGRALKLHDELLLTKVLYHHGEDALSGHAAWRLPSQRPLAWWRLMRILGKV